jgi:glucose/arabinose dehydrogenase
MTALLRATAAVRLLVSGIVAGACITSCAATDPDSATPPSSPAGLPSTSLERDGSLAAPTGSPSSVVDGLEAPWSIAFHSESALISERDSGRILELVPSADPAASDVRVVGTVEGVDHRGEGGLLGLATNDDDLYVYSTADDGNRIERYRLEGTPGSLRLSDRETIVDGLPANSYHNGGRIAFGPDGMLYASVGDAGRSGSAQSLDSLGGKILRMTPQGDVPGDNPFPDSLVYSYGHRNVQGLAWTDDGTLFATEFGQNTWDELNIIRPGENYGWPTVEGIAGDEAFVDPVQQWAPEDASPSGMAAVDGALYIANLRGEVLRMVPTDDSSSSVDYYDGEYGRIRDAVRTPGGELWLITNNTDGRGTPEPGDDRLLRIALAP